MTMENVGYFVSGVCRRSWDFLFCIKRYLLLCNVSVLICRKRIFSWQLTGIRSSLGFAIFPLPFFIRYNSCVISHANHGFQDYFCSTFTTYRYKKLEPSVKIHIVHLFTAPAKFCFSLRLVVLIYNCFVLPF